MDQKLIDYIKQSKKQGFSDEQIKKALLGAGWDEKIIKEALGQKIKEVVFLKRKLPGWVFILAMFLCVVVIVLVVWQSRAILKEIRQTSVDIAEASKNIKKDEFKDWKT